MEGFLGWKRYPALYEVRAEVGAPSSKDVVGVERSQQIANTIEQARFRMMSAILKVLDGVGQRLHVQEHDNVAGWERVCFSVMATRRGHAQVLAQLKASDATDQVVVFEDAEVE